jgi:hypothetical protein
MEAIQRDVWLRHKRKVTFSLGQHTTVFQAEVYAIKACMVENLDRNYRNRNRNIYIFSERQAAIEALGNYKINSGLAWDCHQSLMQLPNITEFS